MEGSNIGAMLGGIAGGIVSLIVVIICMLLINKNGKIKTEYDERQQIVNGKSYKISAITAWVLIIVMIFLDMGEIEIPMERGGQYFIMLAISILAQSSYSIWNDAYYGTNTRIKGIVVYAIVLFLLNAVISAVFIAKGLMIENGVITDMVMCPVAAGIMLIILIEMGIKHYIGKRADREE